MYVKRKKEYEMIERKKEVESLGLNPNDSLVYMIYLDISLYFCYNLYNRYLFNLSIF